MTLRSHRTFVLGFIPTRRLTLPHTSFATSLATAPGPLCSHFRTRSLERTCLLRRRSIKTRSCLARSAITSEYRHRDMARTASGGLLRMVSGSLSVSPVPQTPTRIYGVRYRPRSSTFHRRIGPPSALASSCAKRPHTCRPHCDLRCIGAVLRQDGLGSVVLSLRLCCSCPCGYSIVISPPPLPPALEGRILLPGVEKCSSRLEQLWAMVPASVGVVVLLRSRTVAWSRLAQPHRITSYLAVLRGALGGVRAWQCRLYIGQTSRQAGVAIRPEQTTHLTIPAVILGGY